MKEKKMNEKEYADKVLRKPVRTKAGVTPLTVVCSPRKCAHGTCIYCPGGEKVPQSYTDKSPAIMRAMTLDYDSFKQVEFRLNTFEAMHHPTDKIELILIGGTFLQYPEDYKYNFIKRCYDALNGFVSKDLEEAKKSNEKAKHRCVALCIENRPDNCSKKEIKEMLDYGATRVEIGVQMPDDEIYKKINRGHSIKDVIDATKRLKDAGFKIGYHIMPGLPYSSRDKDLKLFGKIFSNLSFRPDQLKIYPCQIVEDSPLAKIYNKISYKPYTNEETKSLIEEMYSMIPEYCRVMRIMRQIPPSKIIGGVINSSLRTNIEFDLKNKEIKEIRAREVGLNFKNNPEKVFLKKIEYKASNGREIFLQIVDENDILYGLLRLRLTKKPLFDFLSQAIIRELHIYGQSLELGRKGERKGDIQHKGLGKMLMKEAEKIAKKDGFKKISVISGVGVREYYQKLGYVPDKKGIYMEKKLM